MNKKGVRNGMLKNGLLFSLYAFLPICLSFCVWLVLVQGFISLSSCHWRE